MRKRLLLALGALILLAQALTSYTLRREPFLPSPPPLTSFPPQLGSWVGVSDPPLDTDTLAQLSPDDMLYREYELAGAPRRASVFVAYYKTQLGTKNAHDPVTCLPAHGWNPRVFRLTHISLPGGNISFPANYYRVAKEDEEAVVLYWFQTHNAVVTFEQELSLHRVLDAMFDNRTDMALVRIVIPVSDGRVDTADAQAIQVAQMVYSAMLPYFPPAKADGRLVAGSSSAD